MNAASLTATLVASSTLSNNGGMFLETLGNTGTLTATSPDTITYNGTTTGAGGSISLAANTFYNLSTDGAGHVYVTGSGGTGASLSGNNSWTGTQTFTGGIGGYKVNVGTLSGTTCTLTSTGNAGCSAITNGVGDCGTFIKFTSATAVTVTIPTGLAVGCQIAIEQGGAGKVSVNGSAVTAATLHGAHSYTGTSAQYAVIGVTMDASGVAVLTGDGS